MGCHCAPQSALQILRAESAGLWSPHTDSFTFTPGQGRMKKKSSLLALLKQSLLLIDPSRDAILPLSAWAQNPLSFHLRLTSTTGKGEVTLQKRRLQFLALNHMCKHSYHECNHGNRKKEHGSADSLISLRGRTNKCRIQTQSSCGQGIPAKQAPALQPLSGSTA